MVSSTPKPRIAVVCRGAGGGGGVANVALRHCLELAAEFEVVLLSDSFPAHPPCRTVPVRGHTFEMLRRLAHAPAEISFARAVRRTLESVHRSERLDGILFHGDVPAAVAGRDVRSRLGVPFGIVTHGDMQERGSGAFDPRLSALYRWAERRSAPAAALVVALGPRMAEFARSRGAAVEAVVIVPNGIDLAELGEEAVASPGAAARAGVSLLFVGRLSEEKGVLDLVEAAVLLRTRQIAFTLTIAGDGPLAARLCELLPERGLDGVVRLSGAVPRRELGALYRQSDVVVIPSRSEALPLVLLEALALGRPVVACPAGDVPFVLRDGENGLLVPPRDPRALADAIAKLGRDTALRRRIAARARASVLPRLSWAECGRALRAAVRERLLDRNGGRC